MPGSRAGSVLIDEQEGSRTEGSPAPAQINFLFALRGPGSCLSFGPLPGLGQPVSGENPPLCLPGRTCKASPPRKPKPRPGKAVAGTPIPKGSGPSAVQRGERGVGESAQRRGWVPSPSDAEGKHHTHTLTGSHSLPAAATALRATGTGGPAKGRLGRREDGRKGPRPSHQRPLLATALAPHPNPQLQRRSLPSRWGR